MKSNLSSIPRVLTIAGSDSGGGAGIQADLKTFTACGVYGASVITALTAQNTIGVQGIHIPPIEIVQQQLDSVFSDIEFSAVKTGMLPTAEIINVCSNAISKYNVPTLVVDPVLVATSGDNLVSGNRCKEALISTLIPLATIVTPNLPEAATLTGKTIHSMSDVRRACVDIKAMGCKSVLLKGGHGDIENIASDMDQFTTLSATGSATDIFYDGQSFEAFTKPRINTVNTHGTGCTLASAISSHLAKNESLSNAIDLAKTFVYNGIRFGLDIGQGNGPLNHMHNLKNEKV